MGVGIGTTLSDLAAVSTIEVNRPLPVLLVDGKVLSGLNMIAACLSPGAISETSLSHLPPIEASKLLEPVMFPLGRLSRWTMPLANGFTRIALAERGPGYVVALLDKRLAKPFQPVSEIVAVIAIVRFDYLLLVLANAIGFGEFKARFHAGECRLASGRSTIRW